MEEKVTIKQIAKEAGVSIGTVSNVLNGTGRVSQDTINKVTRVMKKMNYIPNSAARSLRSKHSHLIGLIVPFFEKASLIDNPFYWQIVTGIEAGARDHDFHVLLAGLEEGGNASFVRDRNLDGVIVLGTSEDSQLVQELKALQISCVYLDSYLADPNAYQVQLDDRIGGYLGTKHLISLGHRQIALLTSKFIERSVNHERWLGYRSALEEHGIEYRQELVIECPLTFDEGYHAAQQIFQLRDAVSAVFALSDVTAIGLIKGLAELGVSVPGDVSVIGFDNIQYTEYMSPTLTTINQNIILKGQKAIQLLVDQIEGVQSEQRSVMLPVTLKVRQSTARYEG